MKALLKVSSATSGTCQNYRRLVNEVSCNLINALEGVDTGVPIHELLLIEVILSKMKLAHRHDCETKNAGSKFHGLRELLEFLETKCQALEIIEAKRPVNDVKHSSSVSKAECIATKSVYVDSDNLGYTCKIC
jgi:hypothetical protein